MDNCIENLLCDFLGENAILSGTSPCFSWSIRSDRSGCRQEAYLIEIFADSGAKLWDSGWIDSSDTVILCRDLPLAEMMCGYWRVSVRLDSKTVVKSSPSVFYTGIPCGSWTGKWIAYDERKSETVPVSEAYNGRSLPYFWKGVVIDKPLSKAYLYITSLGIYEFYINGVRGHRSYYAPGWTDYSQTIHYQVYDVTEHFLAGENTLCVILGDGWYRGYIDFRSEHYGNGPLCLLAQLVLEFADGTKRIISTDESWRTSFGAFRYGDLQMGEYYNALKAPSFCRKQIDSTFGDPAVVIDRPGLFSLLKPQSAPLPEPVAVLEAKRVHRTNRNSFVFDLGQNISGVVRLRIKAKKGSCIKICYGEMLEEDGTVYTKNLRTAAATDFYIAAGTEVEEYQPHFTTHGFQYAEVWGIDEADVSSLRGIAICAACAPAGTFSCSDERINKLYSNIVWGQRGNFHSIPTDCPQRDERLGWTGDVQVFCKSACYNMDCDAYFRKYLFDMEEAQQPNGAYTDIAPVLRQDNGQIVLGSANAAWGDAGVIVAWNLYLYYADKDLLKRHYPSMKRHVDYLLSDGFDRQNRDSYGDWLNIDDAIPKQVMCLAYMAYDTLLMSKMAGVLDYNEDQRRYATEYGQLKMIFLQTTRMKTG